MDSIPHLVDPAAHGGVERATGAPRVAFQGEPGAFSEEACAAMAPDHAPVPFASFAAVFEALASGTCARAVVPVSNSLAGPVPEVAAWLPSSATVVLASREQSIRLMLLGLPGAALAQIRTVESHPMALKQCLGFIAARGLVTREALDTAGSARIVAAAGDPTRAAVASRLAAKRYGLDILYEGVEDASANRTRFLLLRLA